MSHPCTDASHEAAPGGHLLMGCSEISRSDLTGCHRQAPSNSPCTGQTNLETSKKETTLARTLSPMVMNALESKFLGGLQEKRESQEKAQLHQPSWPESGFTFLQALSATAFHCALLSWVQTSPLQTLADALIVPVTSQPTRTRHSLHAGSEHPGASAPNQPATKP